MTITEAQGALKKFFGYDAFRPMQAEIIQAIYDKRDALVLMPTGGGKSICYQIPAITLEGTAIVVSPLIALMKDQVEGLIGNGVPAAFINSSQDGAQTRDIEDRLMQGNIKLLYVSPEKLVSQNFMPLLKRLNISLFAIDEAHCISSWGHDFRPEYTQLKFIKDQFPKIPVIALTATADKLTRKDITSQLNLQDPEVYISSFDRPNITLTVKPGQKRIEEIFDFLKKHPNQAGIIYCLSRKSCEDVSAKLISKGYRAAYYHAQIPPGERAQVQEDFINDKTPIICATIAFGMGIDKSNVRWVIHYNMPRNVEGYYQEIGRSGRDGTKADTMMFFSYADISAYREMIMDNDSDQTQKEFKLAKLQRMYDYAEAQICRRKMILAYFNEDYPSNCGNCDVCLNPPKQYDGTIAAQKALSAITRLEEKVGMNMLVDVLRGSNRRDIFANKYNEIKTYGAGKEYSYDEWIFLLSQMLHVGLIDIAYDDRNTLKLTNAGRAVLYDGRKVQLAKLLSKELKEAEKQAQIAASKPKSAEQTLKEQLLDLLVSLRRTISQQQGVPPYLIFTDATLQEMAEKRPVTDADLLKISGVGERKLQLYGNDFLEEIRKFTLQKVADGVRVTGSTQIVTWDLFKNGSTIEEIAQQRGLSTMSIVGHLAFMYEKGEYLDLYQFVSPEELDIITGALPLFSEPYKIGDIYEHFEQRYPYDKIKFAIADMLRKSGST
jgi:ATP-dependent DNA helicase RecQ